MSPPSHTESASPNACLSVEVTELGRPRRFDWPLPGPGQPALVVGRSRSAGLTLHDGQISSRHLEVRPAEGGGHEAVELGSTNGTRLDGQPLEPGGVHRLREGATLVLGGCVMVYRPHAGGAVSTPGFDETLAATQAVPDHADTAGEAAQSATAGQSPAEPEIAPTLPALDATFATADAPAAGLGPRDATARGAPDPARPKSAAGNAGLWAVAVGVVVVLAYLGWRVIGGG
ncbi:MAG: FHA domain-containing protein [Planctomycetota bacterium]